jgi:hypothetical protein
MANGFQFYRTTYEYWFAQKLRFNSSNWVPCNIADTVISNTTPIVVYIEAPENVHQDLNQDVNWHAMSLVCTGNAVCAACVTALDSRGVVTGDTMFSTARKLQTFHSGLAPLRF